MFKKALLTSALVLCFSNVHATTVQPSVQVTVENTGANPMNLERADTHVTDFAPRIATYVAAGESDSVTATSYYPFLDLIDVEFKAESQDAGSCHFRYMKTDGQPEAQTPVATAHGDDVTCSAEVVSFDPNTGDTHIKLKVDTGIQSVSEEEEVDAY